MVQSKYSVLIIGCGNMGCLNDAPGSGNEHKTLSFAKALKENGNFGIYYYDKDNIKIENAINIWGGKHSKKIVDKIVAFDNTLTLDSVNFDIIIVSTPDDTHYGILKNILIEKPSLVICEKPLCSTVEEAKEIIRLYEQVGIPILVDYTRRFVPELQELKKHGKGKFSCCRFNKGFLHTGTHAIDFFNMFDIPKEKMNINEVVSNERVWVIIIDFEDGYVFTETRIGDMPVHHRYDHHTRYVIENAYNFLEGKEELKCTMHDALKALEIMEAIK